jgi:hypothetical protein
MVKFYENITSFDTDLLKDIQKEMDSGKPCAMTVYHPQCGHCTNMKPSWKRMGEHMSSKYDGDLVIALVHMDAIDELPIQRERIQGYPHIIFKTKESENEYHGPRDEESFENWIIDNAKNNKYQLIMNNNGNNGYSNNNNNDNNNNDNNNNNNHNHVDITNDVEILDTNFNNNSHMNDPISESEPTEEPEPNHIKSQFDNLIDSLNIYKTPSPMPRPDSNKDMSLSIKISRPETASKPKTRQLVRKSNKKPTRRMKTKSKSKAITKPNTKPKTKSKSVRATRSAKKAKTIRKRKSIMKKTPRKKLYTRKIPSTVKRNKRFHDLKTL